MTDHTARLPMTVKAPLSFPERHLAEIEATLASQRATLPKGSIPAGRREVVVFAVGEAKREMLTCAVSCAGADRIARRP